MLCGLEDFSGVRKEGWDEQLGCGVVQREQGLGVRTTCAVLV